MRHASSSPYVSQSMRLFIQSQSLCPCALAPAPPHRTGPSHGHQRQIENRGVPANAGIRLNAASQASIRRVCVGRQLGYMLRDPSHERFRIIDRLPPSPRCPLSFRRSLPPSTLSPLFVEPLPARRYTTSCTARLSGFMRRRRRRRRRCCCPTTAFSLTLPRCHPTTVNDN